MSTQPSKKANSRGGLTTLSPLLRHFVGLELSVELKNGRLYFGTLHDADDYMNLILSRACSTTHARNRSNALTALPSLSVTSVSNQRGFIPPIGTNTSTDPSKIGSGTSPISSLKEELDAIDYKLLHIRGPSIRYIHFPDRANLPALIKMGLDRERNARDKYRRGQRTSRK